MEYVKDTTVQVLVPDLRTINQPGTRYAWLNGYALISCKILSCNTDDLVVSGHVRIGEHLAENPELIDNLTHALDPAAVLVGMDLTGMMSGLGRLPLDAPDQAPSLALLAKLRVMIEQHPPIDLGNVDADSLDSLNAHLLAETLADQAGTCLLSTMRPKLRETQRQALEAAWKRWRHSLVPLVPEKEVVYLIDA